MVIVCDDRLVAVFTAYLYVVEPGGNDKLLLVDTLLDEYHLVVFHEGAAYLNGLGNVAELGRSVTGHEESVGIVILAGCLSC